MNHVDKNKGFTLVELMLAMGFVSALLLAIAMTVIQIGNIYNRGITFKSVNQAGGAIASELQRSIAGSAPFNIGTGQGGRYIEQPFGGRLCTGSYSYIWNYGKALSETNPTLNEYSDSSVGKIRFVKSLDAGASYCAEMAKPIDTNGAVELLNEGQSYLAIHSFKISTDSSATDSRTGQQLYSIEFTLGTNDRSAFSPNTNVCLLPGETGSDPAYCSVNQFNLTVRASNAAK